ncbi:Uncharacterised protein [Zhongshania aliphaticivorans]|uniref:Big-1 domain-containing protein n=1 Tax=Zhongshania aliphaticivorans TaxID=1470434 RepID=A0A5S9N2L0_9GAMM|nr:hypothetical protein [Zhongshania aliphaticivorans]CAA0083129.1 Uncharacterised protein [Zhongshania aliphaticivorans]CAA0083674.1 Uncharacterised protein [Zhongshania aliphaticivorans]
MTALFRACLLLFAISFFIGCGGGGGDEGPSLTPTDGTGSDLDDEDTSDGSVDEQVVRFGSYSGTTFTAGQIATNNTNLDAGQSATLSVSFIDQNNSPVTDSTDILFTSPCIAAGISEIDPAVATNSTGTATATYTARGCDGDDTITAETSLNGTTYSASVTITAVPSPLGSITFVSADPQIINIKGSGGPQGEQSVITFLVNNESGGPVPNLDVNFYLDTTLGGISISNDTAKTNTDGLVSTTVSAGSVATSVRVTAEAIRDGKIISTESSQLAISTGFPDQDSFSISATKLNIDGWKYEGVTTSINIRAADRFNHPVPDGTAITFWTEGAVITPNCTTTAGKCSVTLESQEPRPSNGRITILAHAIGEESFLDANPTNGLFEEDETFSDISEPFLDRNENGSYDFGAEEFADFNTDGTWNDVNGKFDGLLCDEATNSKCNTEASTAYVSESITIVLSGSSDLNISLSTYSINLTGAQTLFVYIQDARGQVPPVGTTVRAEASQGTIVGPSSYSMPSTNDYGPAIFAFGIAPEDTAGNGRIDITVTTPGVDDSAGFSYSISADVIQP